MEKRRISVVVIDAHPAVSNGVESFFRHTQDIRVHGEANGKKTALLAVQQVQPDVVVLDVAMKGLCYIGLITKIIDIVQEVVIIIYTAHKNSDTIVKALRLGATGYILKTDPLNELENGIRRGLHGSTYLSPAVSGQTVQTLLDNNSDASMHLDCLTKREYEVASYLSRGMSTKKVGKELYISPNTVRIHRRNIMTKLSCDHPNALLLRLQDHFSLPTL
jgi:DNA-binding NarL/FixJ family response regulator